jgi:TolA-binding protein
METASAASEAAQAGLENKVKQLESTISRFERKVVLLEAENQRLQEKLKLALFRQFGRRAERYSGEGQPLLLDDGETVAPKAPAPAEDQETVAGYSRAKRGRIPGTSFVLCRVFYLFPDNSPSIFGIVFFIIQ